MILLIATNSKASGQIKLVNLTLTKPDSNILFLDIENRLKVFNAGSERFSLQSDNGQISTLPDNEFLLTPSVFKQTVVRLYQGKKLVSEKKYKIDSLKHFKVRLGSIKSDSASVPEILANKGLRVINGNELFLTQFIVISFQAVGVSLQGDTLFHPTTADGHFLSDEQVYSIKRLTRTDRLTFQRLVIGGPGTKSRTLNPFTIIIR